MAEQNADLSAISAEEFVELVAGASDEEIASTIRQVGVEATLDRIFEGMQERFLPDKAEGVDARIGFVITDAGAEHAYTVTVRDGSCQVEKSAPDDPKVVITTDLVSFAKMIAGEAEGPQLFMAGKLRIAGDLMFATRIMTFFDRPGR